MIIKNIITKIIWRLPPSLRDQIRNIRRSLGHNKIRPKTQLFIQMIDGTSFHGGLTDRFKGIVSSFLFCKIQGIDFKIHHIHPFDLSSFLDFNKYDWQLNNSNQISYNIHETQLLYLIGDSQISRLLNIKSKKQIHCFANRDIVNNLNMYFGTDFTWGNLFKELFKPNKELQSAINEYQRTIGSKYISAVFRFQNLIGDFEEYNDVSELNQLEKIILIDKCKNSLERLKESVAPIPILVTSDSKFFLASLSNIDNIFAFAEDIVHMDNTAGKPNKVYQKSFVDFYLLSQSEAIYSIGTTTMYKTEFPLFAAKLHDIPFKRIEI